MTIILSTVVVEKRLQDVGFPFVFKICTNPSFNTEAISEAGYDYKGGYAYFRYTKHRQNNFLTCKYSTYYWVDRNPTQ